MTVDTLQIKAELAYIEHNLFSFRLIICSKGFSEIIFGRKYLQTEST